MASFAADLYEGIQLAERLSVPRGSVRFTNTSGQLRIPNGPTSETAYTFTTWIRITTDTNFYALWLSLQGASSTYWETGFDITGTGAEINDLTTERSIGITFTVGKWYFFGVSHGTSGAVKVFIGDEGGTLTKYTTTLAALVLPLSDALLGGELSYEHLDGSMSETRFWNAVLSDAEFWTEYRSETQARTSNSGGYWKLETPSSKFTDSSGNSNTLTNPQGTGTWAYQAGPRIDPAPTADIFEAWGLAEILDVVHTPSGGTSYTGNVSETVTLSEALGAVFGAVAGLAETVSLSESAAALYGAIAALAETVSLSESAAAVDVATVGIAETVSLSESLAAVAAALTTLSEAVGLSEAVVAGTAFDGSVNESVGAIGESLGSQFGAVASISEQIDVLEALGAIVAAAANVGESVALSEALAAVAGAQAALAETVTLSESLASQRGAVVPLAESVALSEALAALAGALAALSETVGWTEGVTATLPTETAIALLARLRESAWSVATSTRAFVTATSAARYTATPKETSMTIIQGTRVRLSVTFTTPTGARYDPATPRLVVEDVDGTETTYAPPNVVQDQTENESGDYYCDVLFETAGDAKYAWRSTASGEETVGEGKIRVLPSSL